VSDLLELLGAIVVGLSLWMLSPWLVALCCGVLLIGVGYQAGRGDE
jgi:hypothetical protein